MRGRSERLGEARKGTCLWLRGGQLMRWGVMESLDISALRDLV